MTFRDSLAAAGAEVGATLAAAIAALPGGPVRDAMGYATEGGKGLRGFLVLEGARVCGADRAHALQAAAAIEAVHAYSLVHDDLPAMDDDDLRRGRPTVHVRWDDATAILAGDALQSLAFELLAGPACHPDAGVRAGLCLTLARAAGAGGMVLGQAQDIAAETATTPLTLAEITALQDNKTGALIRWSAEAGAHLAGADPAPLSAYARALGLAFQIADDLLDVEGDEATAGKRLQKDAEAGKATFVTLLGVDGARARARVLVDEASDALAPYGPRADALRDAARFVVERDK